LPFRLPSLFLGTPVCDTDEVVGVTFDPSARYRSVFKAENHLGRAFGQPPRMDLGHSAGSDLLNRPRAGPAHTPAARAPKRKNFSSQLTGQAELAGASQPASL